MQKDHIQVIPLGKPTDEDIGLLCDSIAKKTISLLAQLRYLSGQDEWPLEPTPVAEIIKDHQGQTQAMGASPEELIEKLIALIPLPRSHTVLYSGCFASHHHLRAKIIKNPSVKKGFVKEGEGENKKIVRLSWSKILAKVFKLDLSVCQKCGQGKIRFVAMVKEVEVIEKILNHLNLRARSPPIAAPRYSQIGLYDY